MSIKDYTIKQILFTAGIVVFISMGINASLNYYNIEQAKNDITLSANEVLPHTFNLSKLQVDIIQIQQWLTAVSATRARDGLDEGYGNAKKHYTKAKERIVDLRAYHVKYKHQDIVDDLDICFF